MERFLIRLTLVISIILLVASALWWLLDNHAISRLFDLILICGGISFCFGGMTLFDVSGSRARGSAQFRGYIVTGGDEGAKIDQHRRRTEMNFSYGFLLFLAGLIILVGSAIRFLVVYYS